MVITNDDALAPPRPPLRRQGVAARRGGPLQPLPRPELPHERAAGGGRAGRAAPAARRTSPPAAGRPSVSTSGIAGVPGIRIPADLPERGRATGSCTSSRDEDRRRRGGRGACRRRGSRSARSTSPRSTPGRCCATARPTATPAFPSTRPTRPAVRLRARLCPVFEAAREHLLLISRRRAVDRRRRGRRRRRGAEGLHGDCRRRSGVA